MTREKIAELEERVREAIADEARDGNRIAELEKRCRQLEAERYRAVTEATALREELRIPRPLRILGESAGGSLEELQFLRRQKDDVIVRSPIDRAVATERERALNAYPRLVKALRKLTAGQAGARADARELIAELEGESEQHEIMEVTIALREAIARVRTLFGDPGVHAVCDAAERCAQAEEAVQHLSAGKPLGEIAGRHTIESMAQRISELEAQLADARKKS